MNPWDDRAGSALRYECDAGPPAGLIFTGRMDAVSVGPIWETVLADALKLGRDAGELRLDLSAVSYCDASGAALLYSVERLLVADGVGVRFESPDPAIESQLQTYRDTESVRRVAGQRDGSPLAALRRAVAAVGHEIHAQVAFIGEIAAAFAAELASPRRVRWGDALRVAEAAGFRALPIVSLIAFLLGVILAFQSAVAMRQFGAEIFVADLVAISLFRELGPLMMGILLAGRTGAAFAAEIGTMKVNEEVNALVTMGLDPVRFLVVPKVLAAVFVAPLLTLYANLIGLVGAALVMRGFGIPVPAFVNQVSGAVAIGDLGSGLFKALVFGMLVATAGCLRGLQTGSGAAAVGRAATSAVVTAIILIVVADGLFAVLYHHLGI